MEDFSKVTNIALEAGNLLRKGWEQKSLKVDFKGQINPVTEIDRKLDAFLKEKLLSVFPRFGILTEESEEISGGAGRFIVDPIDGTTNFMKHYPFVAISVAAEWEGELVFGLVYNPILDELYIAQKGSGATCNGKTIHVSETRELGKAVLGSGFPYDAWESPDDNLRQWGLFLKRTRSLRCDGSAALDLCRVASGQLDGYWEKGLSPWDIAAGAVLIREAGGIVTAYDGSDDFVRRGEVVCSSAVLYKEMIKVLKMTESNGQARL